jgi:ribosomal protein S18 acetylase RimI-like enzyme
VKHDRAFMQLQPIDKEVLTKCAKSEELKFVPFDEPTVEEISKLVFKCVDGTIDQDLFPSVYGSIQKIKEFLSEFLKGTFGTHEPLYSWILRDDNLDVGACFLITKNETGFLAHIVIDPEFRQQGLGKALLCHSLNSLLRVNPSVNKIELAVTLSNPAKRMYDSLGLRTLNDSSTFVWKR